jgi:hypothetical protein
MEPVDDYGNWNNHHLGIVLSIHKKISSEKTEFVSDKIAYIKLKSFWCDVVLNVHAPIDKSK